MMQLGFVSAILPDLTFPQVLQTAAEIGYDCVEVMCWPRGGATRRYAGVTHLDLESFGDDQVAEVRRQLNQAGVQISGLGYYPNPLSADPVEAETAVAQLRRLIEAAALLEIPCINSFIGRDPWKTVEDNWPRFLDTWGPLVELAEQRQVRIGIENCPMLFTVDEWPGGKNLAHSPEIWRKMFEAFPSLTLGLNYDPSHLVFQQMDYLTPIRQFADRLVHVHAKDVRVDQHHLDQVGTLAYPNRYHVPKLPGLGDVHWGRFFSVLGDAGYRGAVCVEVEDRIYESTLEGRKLALQQSHDYLRQFVPQRTA